MSVLVSGQTRLVITSGLKFMTLSHRGSEDNSQTVTVYQVPEPKFTDDENGKKRQPQPEPTSPFKILCGTFSDCGKWLVLCDDYKQMTLWEVQEAKLELRKQWNLERRSNKVIFGNDAKEILIADKSGDVYQFQLDGGKEGGKLLLGHLSMLLDIGLSKCGNYLITCDRDEKIRVSHYPNCYNIHNFCLGHTDFVTSISLLDDNSRLISSSGDGSIKVWTFLDGVCQYTKSLTNERKADRNGEDSSPPPTTQAVKSVKLAKGKDGGLILATLQEGFQGVKLFSMKNDEEEIVEYQTIDTNSEVWDVEWSHSKTDLQLWVMLREEPFVLKMVLNTRGQFEKLENFRLNLGTENEDFFEVARTCKPSLDELYKRWYDNMKDYLEKKEVRLNKENESKKLKQANK